MKVKKTELRLKQTLLAIAAAGVLMVPVMASAQQMPPTPPGGLTGQATPDRPERMGPPKPMPISGTVLRYNFGPRGELEGLILQSGDKITQVNLPPGLGTMATTFAPVGKDVKLMARPQPPHPPRGPDNDRPEPPPADHEVMEFAGIDTGAAAPPATEPADAKVEGKVASLNYGRRGEVNGAVLDTGDFVEVGPRDAAELKLAVGQKISASGDAMPMAGGHQAIGAKEVNGTEIKRPPPPGQRPPRGPDGDDKGPAR